MDWIRRNWPDLLIGIALVAVIAGIVATLLTGGSFLPLGGQSERPATNGQPVISSNPVRPDDDRTAVDPGLTGEVTIDVPGDGEENGESSSTGVQVTALPLPGSDNNDAPQETASSETPAQTTNSPEVGPIPANGDNDEDPATTASQGTDVEGVYRVSVGAFSSNENAERQAQTFREAGFPVFIGTQGDFFIVLVGPYDELNEAEQAASTISAGDYDIEPVIYRFQDDDDTAQASSSAPSGSSGNESASEGQAPPAVEQGSSQPAASSSVRPAAEVLSEASGSFLQVGAYATFESAEPFIVDLEEMGFDVVPITESSLIKLLVGPYSGEDLTEARARLGEEGIENFPR